MFQGDVSCLPMAWGLPFFAPLADTPSGFVYVNDFVMFQAGNESMQGRVKSFLLQGMILCVVWLCSPLPSNKFTQESVSGVYAKIQCVYPVGFDTCSVGDTIEVPVTDIQKVICVPAILKWKKLDSWCLILAGLPNADNQKLHNIHHLCSSNKVTICQSVCLSIYLSYFAADRLCWNGYTSCRRPECTGERWSLSLRWSLSIWCFPSERGLSHSSCVMCHLWQLPSIWGHKSPGATSQDVLQDLFGIYHNYLIHYLLNDTCYKPANFLHADT